MGGSFFPPVLREGEFDGELPLGGCYAVDRYEYLWEMAWLLPYRTRLWDLDRRRHLCPRRRGEVLPKTFHCPLGSVLRHLCSPCLSFAWTCLGGQTLLDAILLSTVLLVNILQKEKVNEFDIAPFITNFKETSMKKLPKCDAKLISLDLL